MSAPLKARSRNTETALVDNGVPRAVIAAPDDPKMADLGDQLAGALREVTGVEFPIVPGSLIDRRLRESQHVLVVGDMSINRFASELYRRIRTFEDCYYPGKGGWVVRSIHDTWGAGTNCLVAAGSDRQGHEKAVASLVDKIAAAWPEPVGFLLDPHPGMIARDSIMQFSSLVPYPQFAYRYLLEGDPQNLDFFCKGALLGEYEKQIHWRFFSHLRQLMLMPAWDLVEESPLVRDDIRTRIVNFFLRCYRSHEGSGWYSLQDDPGPLPGNHGTAAALNLYFAARYFSLRYHLEETREWLFQAHRFQSHYFRVARSSADMGYMEFCGTAPDITTYGLQVDADEFLVSDMMTKAAERAMLLCGNTGYAVCEGEVGFDSKFLSRTLLPHHFFGRVAALTGDGRYQWWARKSNPSSRMAGVHQRSGFFQTWDAGLEPVPPEDHIGIRCAIVDPALFASCSLGRGSTKWHVDAAHIVDKLAIRSGLGSDDAYLAASGIAFTGRGHKDAGAIIAYESCGHVFLIDGGGLKARGQNHHNSVVVIKDGQGVDAAPYMALEQAAHLGPHGFVNLAARDYNSCRWERHIYWRGGDRFLILDCVTPKESGRFAVSSHWFILGESEAVADGVATVQKPRKLVEREDSALRIHCWPGSWRTEMELAPGKYTFMVRAKPAYLESHIGLRVLVDDHRLPDLHLTPGTLYGFGADEEPGLPIDAEQGFEIEKSGPHTFEMSISVCEHMNILSTSVRNASGKTIAIPLADWQPGVEVVDDAAIAYFRIATDQHNSHSCDHVPEYRKDWTQYPLSEPEVRTWVDARTRDVAAGETVAMAHLFGASKEQVPELSVQRTGAGVWAFGDGGSRGIVLDGASELPACFEGARLLAEWETDMRAPSFMGIGARRLGESPFLLSLSEAGAFSWEPEKGMLYLDLPAAAHLYLGINASDTWKLDGNKVTPDAFKNQGSSGARMLLPAGKYTVEHPPLAATDARVQTLMKQLAQLAEVAEIIEAAPAAPREVGVVLEPIADLGSTITALICGGTPAIPYVAGTEEGKVFVASTDMQPTEIHTAGGAIRSLATGDFGSGPVILAGSDDAHVYALQPDGTQIFSHQFCWEPHTNARYSRHSEVLGLLVEDLDGDGVPEIYAGANNETVYKLRHDGAVEWRVKQGTGPASILLPWRSNKPGFVAASTTISSSDNLYLFHLTPGEPVQERYFIGIGWGSLAQKVLLADVDGDGEDEVILVSTGSLVRVFSASKIEDEYPGEIPWMATKWDVWTGVTAVDAIPAKPQGLWIATKSGGVCRYDGNGATVTNLMVPEEPVALLEHPNSDEDIDVVTISGIWRTSHSSQMVPVASLPERAMRVVAIEHGACDLIATESGRLYACRR